MVPQSTRELLLQPPGRPEPLRLTLRHLASAEDYAAAEALQRDTWGEDFEELASATMMRISQKVGGLAAGAFDPEGGMLGFLFGITGLRGGRPAHWSHVMAVRKDARGLGLGRRLKLFQRDYLLGLGVGVAFWTYDPLVARNAHLNLNRLGAEPTEYVCDFYGPGDTNVLHAGIGTDRFIVEWRLGEERVERAIAGKLRPEPAWSAAQVVNADGGVPRRDDFDLPGAAAVRVELPRDIQAVRDEDLETARLWRRSSRRALVGYLDRGYRVRGFLSGDHRCSYVLER